jgi:crotonobetainyl-CoA:carnitine CoA-transferase CaiB-like acyl-CoA transferase
VSASAAPAAREAGALGGLRVLELTTGLAGSVAGMLLADFGADVVKVYDEGEVPNITPARRVWDRNKVGATIERSKVDSVAALEEMVRRADAVLVGTTDEIRGYDALLRRGLAPGAPAVWLVMPPYLLGETPWAAERSSAGLLHAWLGTAWNQASYDDVPVEISYPLALYMQGIWAATTVVALWVGAQRGRASGGLGVVGGAHGAVVLCPGDFFVGRADPHVQRPGGPGGSLPNYRCYRCADGEWLFLGAFTNAFVERGFRAIGAGAVLDDPRIGGDPAGVRVPANASWVIAALESLFAQRPRAEWIEVLEAADVPVGPVLGTADWMDHEQVIAMGLRTSQTTASGEEVVMPGPFLDLSVTPTSVRTAAPMKATTIEALTDRWAATVRAGRQVHGTAKELPLRGLRVLDLGTIVAGPYASTLLGELGAAVVKVERPPHGDELRTSHGGRGGAGFISYNREQRSVGVDLAAPRGWETFMKLVAASDVVVENYRPGVAARLRIDHGHLVAANPLVTSLSISAFGGKGPLGHRPGFDPVVQAMSGIMRSQGGPNGDDSPGFLTVPIDDVLAAALGALGVCTALFTRSRTQQGQHVDVTLCAASCLLQSEYLVRVDGQGLQPRGGRDFSGPGPLERLYRTADGWVRIDGRWPDDADRLTRAGFAVAGDGDLSAALQRLTVGEVVRRLSEVQIPVVEARQPRQLADDEQLIQSALLDVADGNETDGRVRTGRLVHLPGLRLPPPMGPPTMGQHTRAVLSDIGLDAVDIDSLLADGVVVDAALLGPR